MLPLLKVLRKNPHCFIFYHDAHSWIMYKSKADYDKAADIIKKDKTGRDYDKYLDKITVCESSDYVVNDYDYSDPLVKAMGELLGMDVVSI